MVPLTARKRSRSYHLSPLNCLCQKQRLQAFKLRAQPQQIIKQMDPKLAKRATSAVLLWHHLESSCPGSNSQLVRTSSSPTQMPSYIEELKTKQQPTRSLPSIKPFGPAQPLVLLAPPEQQTAALSRGLTRFHGVSLARRSPAGRLSGKSSISLWSYPRLKIESR